MRCSTENPMQTFDLTPDPKVLLALTHTPMQPLDALCELIDNAIDSFQASRLQGHPIKHPLVVVDLPRPSEVNAGAGRIQIRDNGSGLTREQAELALRAGFSGNNPYDSLGLFGMGFNISTGKLGRVTRFLTARQADTEAIEVVVDLEQVRQARSFKVPVTSVPKPIDFVSGTLVEISTWWPEGNANSGFVRKLVQYGMPRVREEIGRRYATILRDKNIQIVINNERCEPFEHCVWSDSRSVERKGQGKVPAVFRFDELIGSQSRCGACTALVEAGKAKCQACGSSSLRTIEERIHGWIGVQRFDDPTEFGMDLIRNGRAIRIGEKTAFFEFTDEFKRTLKDYPIDSPYGRIVGEVHLNHIPVDFLKQDFQRSSPEWLRAMVSLRGESSLQPTQPGADKNKSPVFKLYQGYRRVRSCGRGDMYMGVWDMATDGPRRISRDVEKEYREKFLQKLPGFYDDAEWWKLVEQADRRPLEELVECPECAAQNLKGHDACISCGAVLIGKDCINTECCKKIPQSAASCPHCGKSQIPEILQPWNCQVCGSANQAELTTCSECTAPKGTLHTLSRERLLSHSSKSDELSIPACTVPLADGSHTSPLNVETYVTREPIIPKPKAKPIPLYAIKTPERVELFVDLNHALFKSFRLRPEQMIASEVALVVYDANRRLSGQQHEGLHTLSTLCWQILQTRWRSTLEDSADRLRADIANFFTSLRERLPVILDGRAEDIYDDLDESQQKNMVENMLGRGMDLLKLAEMKKSGQYLHFIDENSIAALFRGNASAFFDGRFWNDAWVGLGDLPGIVVEDVHKRTKSLYLNCLEDIVGYLRHRQPDAIVMQRARASLLLLQQKLA
jgi:hypothetical protein